MYYQSPLVFLLVTLTLTCPTPLSLDQETFTQPPYFGNRPSDSPKPHDPHRPKKKKELSPCARPREDACRTNHHSANATALHPSTHHTMGGRKDIFHSRLGTTFEATRWLSLDTCGLLGVSCSWGLHFFSYGTAACYLIEGSLFANGVFLLLYTPITLLALTSLYKAWTTDPGAVPMGARPLVTVKRAASGEISSCNSSTRALRRCHKCNDNFKAPRAHHDSVTGRCIVKFDHFW